MKTQTTLFTYEFDKTDPYTFAGKYRLVDILKLEITTKLDIKSILKMNNDFFSSAVFSNVHSTLFITDSKGVITNKEFFVDISIYDDNFTLSCDGHSIETELTMHDYVETSKY